MATCPNCGHCPHCGRSDAQPLRPAPRYPRYPWLQPRERYGMTVSPNISIQPNQVYC